MIGKIFNKDFASKALYGSITLLAVLFSMENHPPSAWKAALLLFGTVLSVALAETFSETIAETIASEKKLSKRELLHIWQQARPILVAANLPTLVIVLSAIGLFKLETALLLAEIIVYVTLFIYGLRIGYILHGRTMRILFTGLFTLGIGGLLGLIKLLFH